MRIFVLCLSLGMACFAMSPPSFAAEKDEKDKAECDSYLRVSYELKGMARARALGDYEKCIRGEMKKPPPRDSALSAPEKKKDKPAAAPKPAKVAPPKVFFNMDVGWGFPLDQDSSASGVTATLEYKPAALLFINAWFSEYGDGYGIWGLYGSGTGDSILSGTLSSSTGGSVDVSGSLHYEATFLGGGFFGRRQFSVGDHAKSRFEAYLDSGFGVVQVDLDITGTLITSPISVSDTGRGYSVLLRAGLNYKYPEDERLTPDKPYQLAFGVNGGGLISINDNTAPHIFTLQFSFGGRF